MQGTCYKRRNTKVNSKDTCQKLFLPLKLHGDFCLQSARSGIVQGDSIHVHSFLEAFELFQDHQDLTEFLLLRQG